MKRSFADTDKGQIYFYEQGEGPVLILLHPSPQSGRVYWRLAPELAHTFRVIVPDTLGFDFPTATARCHDAWPRRLHRATDGYSGRG